MVISFFKDIYPTKDAESCLLTENESSFSSEDHEDPKRGKRAIRAGPVVADRIKLQGRALKLNEYTL